MGNKELLLSPLTPLCLPAACPCECKRKRTEAAESEERVDYSSQSAQGESWLHWTWVYCQSEYLFSSKQSRIKFKYTSPSFGRNVFHIVAMSQRNNCWLFFSDRVWDQLLRLFQTLMSLTWWILSDVLPVYEPVCVPSEIHKPLFDAVKLIKCIKTWLFLAMSHLRSLFG